MRDLKNTCRVAVVQATPVMFHKDKCLEKALRLIDEAAGEGAELIVFPELFIPGYPYGMTFGFTVGARNEDGRKDWQLYCDNSIVVPGPETERLAAAAKAAGAYVSIGVSERDGVTGTLYNANLIFCPDGTLAPVHRKLKPTGAERVVWGDADRGYFPVVDTPWGPMGSLICWESYMPLARTALYEKGVTLYISPNTNDNPEWHRAAHRARGSVLLHQLRHGLSPRRLPSRAALSRRARAPERHPLPRRQLHRRPLRALCRAAGVGSGGHPLCRP